jgi:23S rRNA (uracil1939-C5)-methyltransferase
VIVDPPRRGVDAPLLRALSATPPARLVYASCGLPSFLHEARFLLANGALRLRALEAYALFPNTEHVETLALFERA